MQIVVELQIRLRKLHDQAKETSTLPFQINELTGTLLATALNWNTWYDTDDRHHMGMRALSMAIDNEHYDASPGDFGNLDFTMPTDIAAKGTDWRKVDAGIDNTPMDVKWTRGQVEDIA